MVKVSAVSWGEYREDESKTCLDHKKVNERLLIQPGDFLFSRANTIELVGACVIVEVASRDVMLSDKILRIRITANLKKWVLYCLRSRFGRSEIESLATGNQESMRNIGQSRIRAIRLPIPPEQEIVELLSRLEEQLSIIELETRNAQDNVGKCSSIYSSILTKAFAGQLDA